MDFRDYLRILQRRVHILLIVTVLGLACYGAMIQSKPVFYRAEAVLTIGEPPIVWQISDKGLPLITETLSSKAQMEILKSAPFLRYLVETPEEQGGLRDLFPVGEAAPEPGLSAADAEARRLDREAAVYNQINRVKTSFAVYDDPNSEFVTVSATDLDKERAARIAAGVAHSFVTFAKNRAERNVRDAEEFLHQRIRVLEGTPDNPAAAGTLPFLYREVARLRNEASTADVRGETGRFQKRIADFAAEMNRIDRDQQADELSLKYLRQAAASGRVAPAPQSALTATLAETGRQYDQARKRFAELSGRYLPAHPDVVSAAADVDRLRRELDRLTETEDLARRVTSKLDLAERVIPDLERKIEGRKERRGVLRQELIAAEAGLEEALKRIGSGPAAHELLKFESQLRVAETTYLNLQTDLDRLGVQKNMAQSLVTLVSVPSPGEASPLPKQGVVSLWLVGIFAFMIGVVLCYYLEFTSATIQTEYEIKRYVNLPLLDIIFRIQSPDQRLLMNVTPKSALAERFNTLAAVLTSYASENQAKSFMVASSRESEGKSTVISNIAVSLARSGDRVILVDGDFRKPILHKYFNLDNDRGLSSWLVEHAQEEAVPAGIDDLLRPSGIEGLQVIPAGPTPKNPVGLIKSPAFRALLARLKEQADFILVDVPPVNVAVDTMLLCGLLDGVVLLVSAGDARKEEITNAKRLLETAKGRMVGCILNKANPSYSRGYYYYYYNYNYYNRYRYYREG